MNVRRRNPGFVDFIRQREARRSKSLTGGQMWLCELDLFAEIRSQMERKQKRDNADQQHKGADVAITPGEQREQQRPEHWNKRYQREYVGVDTCSYHRVPIQTM